MLKPTSPENCPRCRSTLLSEHYDFDTRPGRDRSTPLSVYSFKCRECNLEWYPEETSLIRPSDQLTNSIQTSALADAARTPHYPESISEPKHIFEATLTEKAVTNSQPFRDIQRPPGNVLPPEIAQLSKATGSNTPIAQTTSLLSPPFSYLAIFCFALVVLAVAFQIGYALLPPKWLIIGLLVAVACAYARFKEAKLRPLTTIVAGLALIASCGGSESAVNDKTESANRARQIAQHALEARENHERRLAYDLAHPEEVAKRKAAARAIQVANEQRADRARKEADQRRAHERAVYDQEHPSASVIAERTKEAAAEFGAAYPNNPLILEIRPESDDPSKVVITIDKAGWDEMSPELHVADEDAFNSQWNSIYQKHGLPGDASDHLGYYFTAVFDSR